MCDNNSNLVIRGWIDKKRARVYWVIISWERLEGWKLLWQTDATVRLSTTKYDYQVKVNHLTRLGLQSLGQVGKIPEKKHQAEWEAQSQLGFGFGHNLSPFSSLIFPEEFYYGKK